MERFEGNAGEFTLYKYKYDERKTTLAIKDYGSWSSAFIEALTFHDLVNIRQIIDNRIDQLKAQCEHEDLVEEGGMQYCSCCGLIFKFIGGVQWKDTGSGVKKVEFEEG